MNILQINTIRIQETYFKFVNKFKGDFKAKSWKNFKDFERDGRIKVKWKDWQTRVWQIIKAFSLLKFVQGFINVRWIVYYGVNLQSV